MLEVLLLSLALTPTSTPAIDPGPVQCADVSLSAFTQPAFAALGDIGEASSCTVHVDCGGGTTVSCSGNTCKGFSRNCPTTKGRVKCDGVVTSCPPCECTNGDTRLIPEGQCCPCQSSAGMLTEVQKCINGTWEFQSEVCKPNPQCRPCA